MLAVAAMWGLSYLATKELTGAGGAAAILALRFIPSAALLLIVVLATRSRLNRDVLWIGGALGLVQAVTLLLETNAVAHTTATNAGVIVSLAIVIAPIAEGFLLRRPLPGLYYVAAFLAVLGVAVMIGSRGLARPNIGDLMVLGAAFTRSALVVLSGRLTAGRDVGVFALTLMQSCLNALLFTLISREALPSLVRGLSATQWVYALILVVGCTFLAFLLQLWAITRTSATRASLLMGTEPVWAVAAGIALGGERLTALALVGAVVTLAATGWGQRVETRWRAGEARAQGSGAKPQSVSGPEPSSCQHGQSTAHSR
ncbi:MAG: DMT family transporter [Segniliparus sp.]|uniref:DMT family transporter n=1 Tax=Segniliparus sp. TaxID=2804064 RepID=UPI003F3A23B3